jgi:hypothetical protein
MGKTELKRATIVANSIEQPNPCRKLKNTNISPEIENAAKKEATV